MQPPKTAPGEPLGRDADGHFRAKVMLNNAGLYCGQPSALISGFRGCERWPQQQKVRERDDDQGVADSA